PPQPRDHSWRSQEPGPGGPVAERISEAVSIHSTTLGPQGARTIRLRGRANVAVGQGRDAEGETADRAVQRRTPQRGRLRQWGRQRLRDAQADRKLAPEVVRRDLGVGGSPDVA